MNQNQNIARKIKLPPQMQKKKKKINCYFFTVDLSILLSFRLLVLFPALFFMQ